MIKKANIEIPKKRALVNLNAVLATIVILELLNKYSPSIGYNNHILNSIFHILFTEYKEVKLNSL